MKPLRVLVVAGDPLARAGLAALLADEEDLVVTGRAEPGEDLAATSEALQSEVIAWDMGWQGEASLSRLSEVALDIPVVALLSDGAEAAEALANGALGALPRNSGAGRIAAALAAAAQSLLAVDVEFARALAPKPQRARDPMLPPEGEPPLLEELTARELEVLRLLAEGLPNKTIAQRLDISEHTVKFHVNSLLGKLGAGSRTEAVVRATRLGLILL
jgi:two-component system, NarL family, nitrate/nitrite response regulator NarL